MKHLSLLALPLLVMACSKNVDQQADATANLQQAEKQVCDFGMTDFNLSKRAPVPDENQSTTNTINPPVVNSGTSVILLDFDGHVVSGTNWNSTGAFTTAGSGMVDAERTNVFNRVANDFTPFNVIVTTNEAVYNAAMATKRVRVIITESWEWYGNPTGGIAFIGSFSWGNNTPCFVFSSLLNYNEKMIGEAVSHEAGHTLGLRHQATFDANCVKTNNYNYGVGAGETGWAPIMGVGYYKNVTTWHKGPAMSCSSLQDEVAMLNTKMGMRADDYTNSKGGAMKVMSSETGIINSSTDVDFFVTDLGTTKSVSLVPFNIAPGNVGANMDLELNIYKRNGQLLQTINDPAVLNAGVSLAPGVYYFGIKTVANQYASTYGMLGQYTIALN